MIRGELTKDGRRILLRFGYQPSYNALIKQVPGASWRKRDDAWAVPADLETGRKLRALFGADFRPDPQLLEWGRTQATRERNLGAISSGHDFPLAEMRVARELPELAATLWAHQRADAVFMARTSCINANEQGTGKTREVIAAVYEAGLEQGPHLVICPVTAIEATWGAELRRWLPTNVRVFSHEDPDRRGLQVKLAELHDRAGDPFWLVVNKEMVRYVAEYERIWDDDAKRYKRVETEVRPAYPELFDIPWATVTIDEFHKTGLSNPKTLGARAFHDLKRERSWAMSGTPMQGKPLKLFGALRWLEPKTFSSKSRWTQTWLEVTKDYLGHQHVGGVRKGLEDDFSRHLSPYLVRRLKAEVFPDLPPKQREDVWCTMTPPQQKQYEAFARDAEIRIEEKRLSATGILAEYARLKLFATACCTVSGRDVPCRHCDGTGRHPGGPCPHCLGEGQLEKLKLHPTFDSGKLPHLLAKLEEAGVEPDEDQLGAIVGSQHVETARMVAEWLESRNYRVATITGLDHGSKATLTKTDRDFASRAEVVQAFQAAGPRAPQVIVCTTQAAGVSLTLDRADSVHVLDETFVPDDQEQLEDRAHRGSRMHLVHCFYYRSKETLEQSIAKINAEKAWTNFDILDARRQGLRATRGVV